MISVRRSCIPAFLQDSDFYLSLNEDDDEEITVAEIHFKQNPSIRNVDDLRQLLHTIRFWGVKTVPLRLINCFMNSCIPEYLRVASEFENELKYLRSLREILNTNDEEKKMNFAVESTNLQILQYFRKDSQTRQQKLDGWTV